MTELPLTHVWKTQSGEVVARLYGDVSLIPEIAGLKERIEELESEVAEIPDLLLIAHMQGVNQAQDRIKALETGIVAAADALDEAADD